MKECSVEIAVCPAKAENSFDSFASANKQLHLSKNDVIYSCRPIYLFSRILGLLPFSIGRDSNGEVQKSKLNVFDILWFVISISVYLFLAYYYTQTAQIGMNSNDSYFLSINDDIGIILGLVFGAISIGINMYNRSRFIDIIKGFSMVDKKVGHMNIS